MFQLGLKAAPSLLIDGIRGHCLLFPPRRCCEVSPNGRYIAAGSDDARTSRGQKGGSTPSVYDIYLPIPIGSMYGLFILALGETWPHEQRGNGSVNILYMDPTGI